VLPARVLQGVFETVEHKVQEFLGVLLLSGVSRGTIKLLESKAELSRVVIVPLAKLEMCDELLQLMHHIVIDFLTLVLLQILRLAIIHAQQVVAEGGHHEELLHHTVHVADAT